MRMLALDEDAGCQNQHGSPRRENNQFCKASQDAVGPLTHRNTPCQFQLELSYYYIGQNGEIS